jgi:hypothetical protein
MAGIPAFCEPCKIVFDSHVIGGGSGTVVGCGVGCPKCGGLAKIVSGFYKNIGGALEIFVGEQSIDDLKKLLSILESAKEDQLKHEEVVANIKQATPRFSKLADCLPKTRAELYSFLVVIIMLIGVLLNLGKKSFDKHELEQQVQIIINNFYEANKERAGVKPTIPVKELSTPKKQVGRNEPCPCGSNKKYKKCCGK